MSQEKEILSIFSNPKLKFLNIEEIKETVIESFKIIKETEPNLNFQDTIKALIDLLDFGNIVIDSNFIKKTLTDHYYEMD